MLQASIADQEQRLRLLLCCIGSKGDILATKLRLSSDCQHDIEQLDLLTMYWDALICFDPDNIDCLTQSQIDKIWDKVSEICGICFAPYGSTYYLPSQLPNQISSRITESNEFRVTEEEDKRVLEIGISSSIILTGINYMEIENDFIVS